MASGNVLEWALTMPVADVGVPSEYEVVQEHREVVETYIQGERMTGRLLGPFQRRKFLDVQVSPFGVIPKSEPGKWRLIEDLSSPEGSSVLRELFSVMYVSG